MAEVIYDHPSCGCHEYDDPAPRAVCLSCNEDFPIDESQSYRYCPHCAVEFTLCRWRRCVNRIEDTGRTVYEQGQLGWQAQSRFVWPGLISEWTHSSLSWSRSRSSLISAIEEIRADETYSGTRLQKQENGHLAFAIGDTEFRIHYQGNRIKFPG